MLQKLLNILEEEKDRHQCDGKMNGEIHFPLADHLPANILSSSSFLNSRNIGSAIGRGIGYPAIKQILHQSFHFFSLSEVPAFTACCSAVEQPVFPFAELQVTAEMFVLSQHFSMAVFSLPASTSAGVPCTTNVLLPKVPVNNQVMKIGY